MKKRERRWLGSFPWRCCWLLLILWITVGKAKFVNNTYPVFDRQGFPGEKFEHLVVNKYTGLVYIGGVNMIYQLTPKLTLKNTAIMGPKEDSPNCPVTRVCPQVDTRPTDYHNKALIIDYEQSRLIACGSLFQGVCTVHDLEDVLNYNTPANESVVANNATASTVAFIAKGPTDTIRRMTHVLYVGVTFTGSGPYRSDVPMVSSRSLDPEAMFTIAESKVTTGTKVSVNSLARAIYPITYVYGFENKDFSYFVTVQKKNTDRPYPFLSKLVRICQNDPHYYSYTEIPLVCRSKDGTDYNLAQAAFVGQPGSDLAVSLGITAQDKVLFVVFASSKDEADIYYKPSMTSALCVYALSAVHRKFIQNIQNCFNGQGDRGLDFINPSQPCQHTQVQINDDFCGMDVNTPLGGNMPVEGVPVLTYSGVLLTAVAATSTHDYTVAFLGTSTGHLKKAVVDSVTSAFEYSDFVIDEGSPVNQDLTFDQNRNNLYVLTERKLTMVKVQECQMYNSCRTCLGAQDPYCGWCSLENKCSLRSDCAQAAEDPLYWLSYKSGKCTTISKVNPPQIQRTTARILTLVINNLPVLDGQFLCAFTAYGKTLVTNATRSADGVGCATPHTDSLPTIPLGKNHFTAKLSVRMKTGPDFVATNFTFYDCSTYSSCTKCVSSRFPCDWCVGGHRCTHDTGENCRNDILVTGIESIGPSIRSGPGFCPMINVTAGSSTEILVPMGIRKAIQARVENTQLFLPSTRFVCQFNIEGRVKQVDAQLLSDTIYCGELNFTYSTRAPNVSATFAVIWEGNKPLDNPENIHALVYRCQGMANNCGICLELPEKYRCGWCQKSKSCQVKETCKGNSWWLDRNQSCPNPQIHFFTPASGPIEGGTNITIDGINLGRIFEDIVNGVTVKVSDSKHGRIDIPCKPFRALYVKTTRIVCEVGSPQERTSHSSNIVSILGPVVVKVPNDHSATSPRNYEFVNPEIKSISPSKGPKSGGTRLRIWGIHMNAGSTAEATIGPLKCVITNRTKNSVDCITPTSDKIGQKKVRVKFDKGLRSFDDYQFLYVNDPRVSNVEAGSSRQKGPRGIPSGGITINVKGSYLNTIQEPQIYVEVNGELYTGHCVALSAKSMKCKSPVVPIDQSTFSRSDPQEFHYGFLMDNVDSLKNLSYHPDFDRFRMFPDPVYDKFSEKDNVKYYKSDYLTINGKHLDRASQDTDVIVRIGISFCNVTSLSRSQLTCRPPTSQPPDRDSNGNPNPDNIPQVVVEVGDNLKYSIGWLSYELPSAQDNSISQKLIIGAFVGGSAFLLVVLIAVILYRRKSMESSRVLKNMQEQMDVLELRVASECKEAFAELQTEMTDLTSDVTAGGIPFLDYRAYSMKVLFPNSEDHPVLREMILDPIKKLYIEKGLRHFGQLVMNKTFLLLFIRTLESNRYFSMKDRVNVASLIMVTLQGKMEYSTDILKTLLADLIEKCIEGKSHPKLLLRRTESVAEKVLSSWFTFLLFKFLKECAGEPLFVLYRAIKQQVDKGPVDAITNEARYSLSEEKLIRQSVEYKCMTVFVSMSSQTGYVTGLEPPGENIETPVKVLDCDTVSQVKEKALDAIYKNTPFSQRPEKSDLDLEWRTGTHGRLTLSDEDSTSRLEGGWRRLNTLSHYKVPDGALLTLVPRQSSMYNISIMSEKNEKSYKYETLNFSMKTSPPLSQATSPLNHDLETNFRPWHLVKHHDAEPKEGERGNKMVSEIYLTRLLATKGTLQKFVDDLFETIFSTAHRGSALPLAIKYIFDFLDDQAVQHEITDREVVHTWKSNSLPLRFWVNLIKNPNFVFDINKSNIVDSCLSVVAQTFMDACSTSDHRLGKDSPSSKLLYAKDIPIYKDWVDRYYQDIQGMPAISDQDMNAMLAEESRQHAHEFNTNVALHHLYSYALKYNDQLMVSLEEDEFSRKNRLSLKLEQVHAIMTGESEA
ncbi:plexin-A2-like [Limulus polyphemus]|uniref:Plexin-A2-like n=1 Tax=Limulus polyphemus TaxID=6850 RepID=A0ABM1BLX7_LIMPO|nr:plexin-A2-like [Limulus polyphemus]